MKIKLKEVDELTDWINKIELWSDFNVPWAFPDFYLPFKTKKYLFLANLKWWLKNNNNKFSLKIFYNNGFQKNKLPGLR